MKYYSGTWQTGPAQKGNFPIPGGEWIEMKYLMGDCLRKIPQEKIQDQKGLKRILDGQITHIDSLVV